MAAKVSQSLSTDILHQPLRSLLWRLSVPSIIGMSINGINAFVDALFVGQMVGQDALAAISIAFPLTVITNGLASMIGVGCSSLLSRSIGADDMATQEKILGILGTLSIAASALLMGVGLYFARDLIAFMGGKGEILDMGTAYYRIMLYGAFFRIYGLASNMLIRAEGKVGIAMTLTILSTLLNMVLNPIFIGPMGWGIEGAGWATVAAMVVYTLLNLLYFIGGRAGYPVKWYRLDWVPSIMPTILGVGVSAMMLQMMFFVQQAVVFKSLAFYGDDQDLAFMGACYRVIMLAAIPSFGFSQALQPVAGINYGAKAYDRVRKAFGLFTWSSTGLMTLLWAFFIAFPATILSWMMPGTLFSPQDIFNFRMMVLTLPTFPIFFTTTTLFQSIGNGKVAGLILVSRDLLLFVPVVLILPLFLGIDGIYLTNPMVNVVVLGMCLIWLSWQFRRWGEYVKAT